LTIKLTPFSQSFSSYYPLNSFPSSVRVLMLLLALPYSHPFRQKQVNLLHLHGIVQIHGMPIRYSIVKELEACYSLESKSLTRADSDSRLFFILTRTFLLMSECIIGHIFFLHFFTRPERLESRPRSEVFLRPVGCETRPAQSQAHTLKIKWRFRADCGVQRLPPTDIQ
jgi:hypothetical protein